MAEEFSSTHHHLTQCTTETQLEQCLRTRSLNWTADVHLLKELMQVAGLQQQPVQSSVEISKSIQDKARSLLKSIPLDTAAGKWTNACLHLHFQEDLLDIALPRAIEASQLTTDAEFQRACRQTAFECFFQREQPDEYPPDAIYQRLCDWASNEEEESTLYKYTIRAVQMQDAEWVMAVRTETLTAAHAWRVFCTMSLAPSVFDRSVLDMFLFNTPSIWDADMTQSEMGLFAWQHLQRCKQEHLDRHWRVCHHLEKIFCRDGAPKRACVFKTHFRDMLRASQQYIQQHKVV